MASLTQRLFGFGSVESGGEALLFAEIARAIPEPRLADSGRAVLADDVAVLILAEEIVDEQILRNDDVAFHAHHFGDVGDAPRAVAQARGLHDDVDRGYHHLADGTRGQLEAAHRDHRFKTRERLARAVRMQRAHRAVVAGVHRLQKVECLGSAYLADDDALGPHTQAVAHEIAHLHFALALEVGRTRLETHHMRLLRLQFCRVLAGDDALVVIDIAGKAVQERRLARAGAAGNQRVHPTTPDHLEKIGAGLRERAVFDELFERQLVAAEFTDGERGTVDRRRRHDDVDARAVRQARVADRARFVDAAADLTHDALADIVKLLVVAETDAGPLNLALNFDVDRVRPVHHDIGDVVAREQWLKRTVAKYVVADLLEELFLLRDRHHDVLDRNDLVDDVANFLARRHRVELGELREVDRLDQGAENLALHLVEVFRPAIVGDGRRRRTGRGRRRGSKLLARGERRRHRFFRRRRSARGLRTRGRMGFNLPDRRVFRSTLSEHHTFLTRADSYDRKPLSLASSGEKRSFFSFFTSARLVRRSA